MRVLTVFAAYWACSGSALASSATAEVWHRTGNGAVHPLFVASQAVGAHLRHGDHLPFASYADADGDGFGDPYAESVGCEAPEGTVVNADDCDDDDAFVRPDPVDPTLCTTELDGWTVSAGRVERGDEPGTIGGSFTFDRLWGAQTRGGGGCLLADLFSDDPVLSSYSCTTDTNCAHVPRPSGGFVYCASPDGSREPNRCWTRPTNNCSRGPSRTPGEYPIPPSGAVAGDAGQGGVPVRWIVIGCLADDSDAMGCAKPDLHVYSYGPVYWWTAEE